MNRPLSALVPLLVALVVSPPARAQSAAPAATDYAGMRAAQLVRRLSAMPAADFLALLSEDFQLCAALGIPDESDIPRRQRCRPLTAAQRAEAGVRRMQRAWRFGDDESGTRLTTSSLRCERRGELEVCRANVAGPAGSRFTFRGAGAARRLVKVLDWSLDS